MRPTLLDNFIMACLKNQGVVPMFKRMAQTIEVTVPVMHMWDVPTETTLATGLPRGPITWPDTSLCLGTTAGVTAGYHRFCIDTEQVHEANVFQTQRWYLMGAMIWVPDETSFEVIPLVMESNQTVILPEIQLHFEFIEGVWTWRKAVTGFVNPLFYDGFISTTTPEEQAAIQSATEYLGNVMNLYIGSYLQYIQQAGKWVTCAAKAAKYKMNKDGKITKVYKAATAGYSEYQVTKEKKNVSTENGNA